MTNHVNIESAKRVLNAIDLTSLSGAESEQDIIQLCKNAITPHGHVAAICVYPCFVPLVRLFLKEQNSQEINIATVVNFPDGQQKTEKVVEDTLCAIANGADEIDVVLPYQALLGGDAQQAQDLLLAVKQVCTDKIKLKVIIESGELGSEKNIVKASEICLSIGADFIKTSTGKVPVNATLDAARTILGCIKKSANTDVGLKVSGGIQTTQLAAEYLRLADDIMGSAWADAQHFRIGASSLLSDVTTFLQSQDNRVEVS